MLTSNRNEAYVSHSINVLDPKKNKKTLYYHSLKTTVQHPKSLHQILKHTAFIVKHHLNKTYLTPMCETHDSQCYKIPTGVRASMRLGNETEKIYGFICSRAWFWSFFVRCATYHTNPLQFLVCSLVSGQSYVHII